MTHIDEHFSFGRIAAPKQWHSVDEELRASEEPTREALRISNAALLNATILSIKKSPYTPDREKDVWRANAEGDCEDKCLAILAVLETNKTFNSLRLAICELPTGQQHAVLLLYTEEGTKVIDPTLSTMAVDWEKYPVNKWIIRHRNGFLWENFKEAK